MNKIEVIKELKELRKLNGHSTFENRLVRLIARLHKPDDLPARMILKAKNQKYNKLVAKYQKITNGGGRSCEEVIKDIDDYTHTKLIEAGFKIEKILWCGYYVYNISWHDEEETN